METFGLIIAIIGLIIAGMIFLSIIMAAIIIAIDKHQKKKRGEEDEEW